MTDVDRRQFLAVFAATGLSSTLLPGILWAQIQPGTRTITVEMIRESAHLAGIAMADEEAQDLAAKGTKMRGQDGITTSPRGYLTANIDPSSSHGLWFQLAEGSVGRPSRR